MKLLRCYAENFASYASLELDISGSGLTLVHGATGSGKSTIMDVACWVLYATTSKDGNADEVRSWKTPNHPTKGVLDVELANGKITVTRVRGKPSENDLYWTEPSGELRRGKDLKDTQKLLESRLNIPSDLYITGSYFHEFSPSSAFFTATAKDRRALFERIADTSLPDRIAVRSSDARKNIRSSLDPLRRARDKQDGVLGQLKRSLAGMVRSCSDWEGNREAKLAELETRSKGFEKEKESKIQALGTSSTRWEQEKSLRLEKLIEGVEASEAKVIPFEDFILRAKTLEASSRCKSCGALPDSATKALLKVQAEKAKSAEYQAKAEAMKDQLSTELDSVNPFTAQIATAMELENHYSERIAEERAKRNPFEAEIDKSNLGIAEAEGALIQSGKEIESLEHREALLSRLYDLSFTLRGELLRKAIYDIQESTNRYLETYFDAELRVSFSLDADDLEVAIQKSGYECVYRQLSKGQRGLLKLCFAVSVMKAAANTSGVHFDQMFFDEALDGLDPELKVKAFGIFEELSLEHGSIFVVEHASEFKQLFSRRLNVTMDGDESRITDESEDIAEGTRAS